MMDIILLMIIPLLVFVALYSNVRIMTLKKEISLCRSQLDWYEKKFEEMKKV